MQAPEDDASPPQAQASGAVVMNDVLQSILHPSSKKNGTLPYHSIKHSRSFVSHHRAYYFASTCVVWKRILFGVLMSSTIIIYMMRSANL